MLILFFLIDIVGCDVREKEVEDEVLKGNEGEVDIVVVYVMVFMMVGF